MYKFVASINTYPAFSYLLPKMNRTYLTHLVKVALGGENQRFVQTFINNKRLSMVKTDSWQRDLSNWLVVLNIKECNKGGDF